jgi:UDP-4-amino-4,6-dideoxy-N-acetyl-beta-L-altrosamine N-acetyltransferase
MEWRMRPDITKHMCTDPQLTLEGQRKWFAKLSSDPSQCYWVVEINGKPVGVVNLTSIDCQSRMCVWGYYIADLSARSLKLAMFLELNVYDFVFERLGLNRLYGYILDENMAIMRLHERCGSKVEGTLRQHIRKYGVYHDLIAVGILAEEWREIKPTITYDVYDIEQPMIFDQIMRELSH